jgi:hypothetical protein
VATRPAERTAPSHAECERTCSSPHPPPRFRDHCFGIS